MTRYLSRLVLSRAPSIRSIAPLLDPAPGSTNGHAASVHHRLVWSAFSNGTREERDFLWRADGKNVFFTLSTRPPNASPLFEPPDTKPFSPMLSHGDRLAFRLRVHATVSTPTPEKGRGKRHDIVMHRLKKYPPGERADKRMELSEAASREWLSVQGEKHGFALLLPANPDARIVQDYSVLDVARREAGSKRNHRLRAGVLDIEGRLKVTDPDAFLAQLYKGFGRARAFGNGLMLIRRA